VTGFPCSVSRTCSGFSGHGRHVGIAQAAGGIGSGGSTAFTGPSPYTSVSASSGSGSGEASASATAVVQLALDGRVDPFQLVVRGAHPFSSSVAT
jgi:hypothetical protein